MTDQKAKPIQYRQGGIELDVVTIWNFKKNAVVLNNVIIEFNIYYDLYGNGSKLEMVLIDSNGLIEMMPIVGDETCLVQFKTPTFKTKISQLYRIYKVDSRGSRGRAEVYVLHGVSQEVMADKRKSVNKSYSQLKPERIVESIYEDYLRPTQEEFGAIHKNQPPLELQETQFNKSFCFPGIRPFQAIKQVCNESVLKADNESSEPKSKSENFMFYQTPNGWVFKTLDSLLRQEPVDKFFHADTGTLKTRKTKEGEEPEVFPHQYIHEMKILNQLDTLKNLEQGLYSHVVKTIDPLLKKFTEDVWTWADNFAELTHIEDDPKIYTDESMFSNDVGTSVSNYIPSNIGEDYQNTNDFTKRAVEANTDFQITNPRNLHSFLKYMTSSMAQLTNIVLEIIVPGNTDVEVGNIIEIYIPQSTSEKDFMQSTNMLYGTKFLVTAVRHTYNKADDNFFTVFNCIKDTYAKDSVKENATEGTAKTTET